MSRRLVESLFLVFGTLISSSYCDIIAPGWCAIYEECGLNPEVSNAGRRGNVPCKNNVEAAAHSVPSAFTITLKDRCPQLVPEGSTEIRACCSPTQLDTMAEEFKTSDLIFQRCPSCSENFRNMICQNTCSPDQSTFVNVTRVSGNKTLEYYSFWNYTFAEEIHDSCRNVIYPQTNGKSMDLMCGSYSGDECTVQRWFEYIGSTSNGFSPLEIKYDLYDETTPPPPDPYVLHYSRVYSCAESPDNSSEPCSCTDCPATCPLPPPLEPTPPPFTIGTNDGMWVIAIIIYCSFTAAFIVYLVVWFARKRKRPQTVLLSEDRREMEEMSMVNEADINCFENWGKRSQDFISTCFRGWGTFVARHPGWVIFVSTAVVVALTGGLSMVVLTTDPIQLWSSEGSNVRTEKDFYDENFVPFYRTNQVIIKLRTDLENDTYDHQSWTGRTMEYSAILDKPRLLEILELQNEIRYVKVPFLEAEELFDRSYITLNDVCFKALEPDNTNCTIMTAWNYWQNEVAKLNEVEYYWDDIKKINYTVDYRDHFYYCTQAPSSVQDTTPLEQSCLGDYGGPVFPFVALGGFEDDEYYTSKALILSFLVNNIPRDTVEFRMATAWEAEFLKIVQNWGNPNFTYAYFSERSIEDELVRQSQADLIIFAGSYIAIFIYITIGLGTYTSLKRVPVDSKVTLGLVGILVILGSVFASIGFYGYVGIATSLIVIEVVPFLVLAIGADNVFILTLEFQRDKRKPGEDLEDQVGRVLGEVAPSMLLCSLTEAVAFFLGCLSDMPAVQQFAACAALAIAIDFLLQVSVFVAVMTLDAKRQQANRADLLCCIKSDSEAKPAPTRLQDAFKDYYGPALMNNIIRVLVLLGFLALFCWSIYVASDMTVGLDQDLSVPLDSYVLDYFDYMEKYLAVGVPVYFVTKGAYNFSDKAAGNMICSSSGCDLYSLTQQITYASQNPEYWKIETPATSWFDDYQDWIISDCCRYHNDNESSPDYLGFCPSTNTEDGCSRCLSRLANEPTPDEFMQYLPWFLIDNPGETCSKGGHASYGNAVSIQANDQGQDEVVGSYFMAYHSICIKSTECTDNLRRARQLAENITKTLRTLDPVNYTSNFEVYPYSLYYVYYEQYLTMVPETLIQLGICLIPTFIFNFILLGFDLYSGFITTFTIIMIVVDTAGICSLWGVDLNAVSLINLVAAIGLSIEFTSHVVRSFSLSIQKGRKRRVIDAMGTMGPAVFAGVALTNLPGIVVLAFAKSQLIQIFFFRMCLVSTLLGMAHGLIFLPVFLSYFGPPVNKAILLEKQRERLKEKKDSLQYKASREKIMKNPAFEDDEIKKEHEYENRSMKALPEVAIDHGQSTGF